MGCTVVICPSTQGRRVRPPGRTGGGGKRDCMHYQYQVAGIAVGFRLPFRLTITEESQAFLRELGEPASGFQVHFLPVPALDPPEPDGHWEVCQYHMETASERRVYHCPTPQAPPYACMIWQKIPGNQAQCQYLAGKEEYLAYSRNICEIMQA